MHKNPIRIGLNFAIIVPSFLLFVIAPCLAQTQDGSVAPASNSLRSPSPQELAQILSTYTLKIPDGLKDESVSGNETGGGNPGGAPQSKIANIGDRFKSRDRYVPRREDRTAINLGNKHINAIFGGLEQGASFGFGVELTTADTIPGVEFRATAIGSFKLYRRFELAAIIPKIGDENTYAQLWFSYLRRTKDNFFGIGPRTPNPPETNFDNESREFFGTLYHDFTDRLRGGIYAGISNTSIYRGQDENDPPIDLLYSGDPTVQPITRFAPGLRGGSKLFSYGAGLEYDNRNNEVGLTKGFYLYGRIASVDGLDKGNTFSDFGWIETELDGRGYIPLGSDKTSFAMRALLELKNPKRGSQIPFYAQSYIGGRSHLRGFRNFRFRGNKALLLATELRQTVYPQKEDRGVDIFGFGDAGQVWGDNRSKTDPAVLANNQFDSKNWRFGMGGGAQYRWNKTLAVRVEIAHTNERNQVYFSISRGF